MSIEGAVEVARGTSDICIALSVYYVRSEFEKALQAVSGQRSELAYEVLAADSGSSKGPGRSPGGISEGVECAKT